MESKKRKREEGYDLPRIKFHVAQLNRSFERLFQQKSREELCDVVRKKLNLDPNLPLDLHQVRDGVVYDLEDDDDFAALKSAAYAYEALDVHVKYSTHLVPASKIPKKSKEKGKVTEKSTDGPSMSAPPSSTASPPKKAKRKRVSILLPDNEPKDRSKSLSAVLNQIAESNSRNMEESEALRPTKKRKKEHKEQTESPAETPTPSTPPTKRKKSISTEEEPVRNVSTAEPPPKKKKVKQTEIRPSSKPDLPEKAVSVPPAEELKPSKPKSTKGKAKETGESATGKTTSASKTTEDPTSSVKPKKKKATAETATEAVASSSEFKPAASESSAPSSEEPAPIPKKRKKLKEATSAESKGKPEKKKAEEVVEEPQPTAESAKKKKRKAKGSTLAETPKVAEPPKEKKKSTTKDKSDVAESSKTSVEPPLKAKIQKPEPASSTTKKSKKAAEIIEKDDNPVLNKDEAATPAKTAKLDSMKDIAKNVSASNEASSTPSATKGSASTSSLFPSKTSRTVVPLSTTQTVESAPPLIVTASPALSTTTISKKSSEKGTSKDAAACPLCLGSFHFRYKCPIITSGLESMQKRRDQLLADDPNSFLIPELNVWIRSRTSRDRDTSANATNADATSSKAPKDPKNSSVPTLPPPPAPERRAPSRAPSVVPPHSMISEVPVETQDEGSESDTSSSSSSDGEDDSSGSSSSDGEEINLEEIDLDALARGPIVKNVKKVLKRFEEQEQKSGPEDEERDEEGVLEDEEEPIPKRTKDSHLRRSSSPEIGGVEGDEPEEAEIGEEEEKRIPDIIPYILPGHSSIKPRTSSVIILQPALHVDETKKRSEVGGNPDHSAVDEYLISPIKSLDKDEAIDSPGVQVEASSKPGSGRSERTTSMVEADEDVVMEPADENAQNNLSTPEEPQTLFQHSTPGPDASRGATPPHNHAPPNGTPNKLRATTPLGSACQVKTPRPNGSLVFPIFPPFISPRTPLPNGNQLGTPSTIRRMKDRHGNILPPLQDSDDSEEEPPPTELSVPSPPEEISVPEEPSPAQKPSLPQDPSAQQDPSPETSEESQKEEASSVSPTLVLDPPGSPEVTVAIRVADPKARRVRPPSSRGRAQSVPTASDATEDVPPSLTQPTVKRRGRPPLSEAVKAEREAARQAKAAERRAKLEEKKALNATRRTTRRTAQETTQEETSAPSSSVRAESARATEDSPQVPIEENNGAAQKQSSSTQPVSMTQPEPKPEPELAVIVEKEKVTPSSVILESQWKTMPPASSEASSPQFDELVSSGQSLRTMRGGALDSTPDGLKSSTAVSIRSRSRAIDEADVEDLVGSQDDVHLGTPLFLPGATQISQQSRFASLARSETPMLGELESTADPEPHQASPSPASSVTEPDSEAEVPMPPPPVPRANASGRSTFPSLSQLSFDKFRPSFLLSGRFSQSQKDPTSEASQGAEEDGEEEEEDEESSDSDKESHIPKGKRAGLDIRKKRRSRGLLHA